MMHIEQMTEADHLRVAHGSKNDMVAMYFVIGVAVFAVLMFIKMGEVRGLYPIIAVLIAPIAAGVIWKIKRRTHRERQRGEKEVYIGPTDKIIRRGRGALNVNFFLSIDGIQFPVSSKTFNLYNEGEVLRIERAKETKYTLSVSKA